jgi:hypothetical protein
MTTLRFLGRATGGGGCPALYETDHGTFVIQGWRVTDSVVLSKLDETPSHETVIEVPRRLMQYLPLNEVTGEPLSDQGWAQLFRSVRRSACHLEMRDQYAVAEEADALAAFLAGRSFDREQQVQERKAWLDLVRETTSRGVEMRRARIVSEPVSRYIRFEHAGTALNIEAGEQVRWLPRRLASGIALPGNDLWLFDHERVLFNLFTGDGAWAGQEMTEAPAIVDLCRKAFEAVWSAATPHEEYPLR